MSTKNTLRLLFPQWQGGDNPPYFLGAKMLDFLAPSHSDKQVEIPVSLNDDLSTNEGIFAREPLIEQLTYTEKTLKENQPDQVIVLGGDCAVDLAPIAFMNEKYDEDVAVLWVDAHPDMDNKTNQKEHHSHVLANLLGHGDDEFVAHVPKPLKPENVLMVGLRQWMHTEKELLDQLNLTTVAPSAIAEDSSIVLDWLKSVKASKVFIHFDLDVLDLMEFRSVLLARPDLFVETVKYAEQGVSFETVIRLLQDVANQHEVIGLGITEHFPWDSYALQNMLARLPLIGDPTNTQKPTYNWRF